ncbi:hypothetical protein LTR53_018611, partial [Teratosphaeriaceae sp. CCFEE 6253]
MYHGSLTVLPMEEDLDIHQIWLYQLNISSVTLTDAQGTVQNLSADRVGLQGTIDSGAAMTVIPEPMFRKLVKMVGAYSPFHIDDELYVPCENRHRAGSLDFEFASKESRISVSLWNMITPGFDLMTGEPMLDENGARMCQLMVAPGEADSSVLELNQVLLRSAYVVHHLDENVLGIAQVREDTKAAVSLQNVVEIKP